MRNAILAFAANSTNQSDYCIKLVNKMHFKSEEISSGEKNDDAKLVFYDVEVFPNLFLVNWKIEGEGKPVVRMINPSSSEIEDLMKFRLVGFNCRRYDNHILYARLMGYDNEQLYKLSQKIIKGSPNCFFGEAYNVSYTDVYDFCSKKQSLKKWEIELGIHHQELGIPWDQPVPEELWTKVAEYCDNDVLATEAVFNARKADFTARQILADVAGMTVNDTTNTLTTKIIFGNNKKPQDQFNYRNMGEMTEDASRSIIIPEDNIIYCEFGDEYTVFDGKGRPIFPGYKFEGGKSTYRGEEVGEGGYVYSEPGMYGNVALLDIASMHPSSIVAENLFGDEYTQRFKEILDARMAIKHKDFDKARKMLGGALAKYLTDENAAADLSTALKIAINSVYGLTSASFDNPFRDTRNKDNIVAKRGALFMINLKHEVQKRGFIVAHIKTDSIKIPDATPEIIKFVSDYGNQYGYTFEHEATYDRFCLVNDAVYIAKYKDGKNAGQWTATGTQFQVPYVFKKLFSKEEIIFDDMCETKSVTSALYLDMNEDLPDVSEYEKEYQKLWKDINNQDLPNDEEMKRKCERVEELRELIDKGHNYRFIGKVGRFCPIKPGCGGGLLMREKDGKYYAATGSKGYRWLESEMVTELGKEADIDRSYYDTLVDEAVKSISEYGDFEWFVSDDPYIGPKFVDGKPLYFDEVTY
jgi:DNA polymerase elongation subunit (family B)